jgi:hypothetical protein
MRLVVLKGLTRLPRNEVNAILLGRETNTIPYRYHVAIPGDPAVFSLTEDKINFREDMKGFTLVENIENIKRYGDTDMINSWENIRISPVGGNQKMPELWGKLGSTNPVSKKLAPQFLSGVQIKDNEIEYQFLQCFDKESADAVRRSLFAAWEKNDMPLRDARPWIHDMDGCVGGLASCNQFYANLTEHASRPKKLPSALKDKHHDRTKDKHEEESTFDEHIRQSEKARDDQTRNDQRIIYDRNLRLNAAILRNIL